MSPVNTRCFGSNAHDKGTHSPSCAFHHKYFHEIVAEAAGQGVAITGDKQRDSWDWGNSVIFAATIVTTIGYGNVAPKTECGRVFCILYGLCGIPLCLVWISQLGSFFGDRARRLSQVLIRKGVSVKKVQLTCTACFLLWGLIVHLVIPPFVFMSVEEWTYLEGLYFSFITLTTVGFGDYVAGVNPNIQYPRLYRVFAEVWIYMGLAWLSLFFSWNVHMVVKAHQVLRKRRQRHRLHEEEKYLREENETPDIKRSVIDIFNFLSETNEDDYNTVIGQIALDAKKDKPPENINRSKSCSDILDIQLLEQSPRQKRRKSVSEMFLKVSKSADGKKQGPKDLKQNGDSKEPSKKDENSQSGTEDQGIVFTVPANIEPPKTQNIQSPASGESRFTITKVVETDALLDKEGKG